MDILTSISFWLSIAFLISAAGTIYADYRFGKNLSEQEIVKARKFFYIHHTLTQSPQDR